MALSYSNLELFGMGNRRMHRFDVDFDSSYPTGGESLDLGLVRMRKIDVIIISPKDGYLFEYDYTNDKIQVITPVAEVADSLEITIDVGATAVKSSSVNGDIVSHIGQAGISAAAGSEVAPTTDLSSLTGVRCLAIGY